MRLSSLAITALGAALVAAPSVGAGTAQAQLKVVTSTTDLRLHYRGAGVPDTRPLDARAPEEEEETKTVPGLGAMDDIHREREDD